MGQTNHVIRSRLGPWNFCVHIYPPQFKHKPKTQCILMRRPNAKSRMPQTPSIQARL